MRWESRIVQETIRRNQQALDELYDNLQRRPAFKVIDGGRPDHAPRRGATGTSCLMLVQSRP